MKTTLAGLDNLPDIITSIGEVLELANKELQKTPPHLYNMGVNNYQFGEYDTITPIYYFDGGKWKQIMFN